MTTRSIEKVNVKIKEQLNKVQVNLNKLVDEIKNQNEWIYFENKEIIINKEKHVTILNTKSYENQQLSCGTDVRFLLDSNNRLMNAEGLKWGIPDHKEIEYILNFQENYPNKSNSGIRFKNDIECCYILCSCEGKFRRYDTTSGDLDYYSDESGSLFPIIRIKEKNIFGVVKFIIDKELIPQNINYIEILKDLIKFNKSYGFLVDDKGIYVDEKTILNDLRNNSLKVRFSISTEEIKDSLLEIDKKRADIESYDEKMLSDPNRGHWDLWKNVDGKSDESEVEANLTKSLVGRDPRADIKKSGVVGIDFGTKSTVVVHQEKNNYTLPMRVGTGRFGKAVEGYQYENPTVMEFVDINSFMKSYNEALGRPETKWSDLTISHTANNSLLNSSSEHYYSYFSELKQWCGNKDKRVKIKDKNNETFDLPTFLEIKEDEFNPVEVYAYYVGSYINNMHNGIYLKYILSFPVTYEKEIKNKVIESFERGLRKSLPETLHKDESIMSKFKVEEGANESAAYAISALQAYEFEPEDDENIFYGVFDFGGGTTDFDFGIWRAADEDKEDRYDYVIEHFGAGGDRYLGGENLLELLAFEVFKENADKLREEKITFMLPPECRNFPGSEVLLSESEEAKLNMRQLMEKLRPITEHQEGYENIFNKGIIGISLYNNQGVQVTNISLDMDLEVIENKLRERIEKGIRNFFESLRLSFNSSGIENIEKVNILLAGNSSKSKLVREIFDDYISVEELDILKETGKKGTFEIYPPLGTEEAYEKQEELGIKVEKNNIEKPTGKTGVAFGLIDSRKGGNIKVVNRNIEEKDAEVKFKFFIGRQKRKYFKVYMDKTVEYRQWVYFIDASEEDFELYYTTLPEAGTNKLEILDVDRINISIDEANEDAEVYLRAVAPTIIEYVVATKEGIEKGEYLSNPIKINLQLS